MVNVFKKLIRKEFGDKKYEQYVGSYHKKMLEKNFDYRNLRNEEIYNDIYNNLKDKDLESLKKMFDRLTESMLMVVKISRTYFNNQRFSPLGYNGKYYIDELLFFI